MMRALTCWLLVLVGWDARPGRSPDDALLPPDGFRQAWKRSGAATVFTSADLYGYIDGGAEIFFEFGFEWLTVQSYARSAPPAEAARVRFKAEVYRMADPFAATGIYLLKCGRETPDRSFRERHTVNKYQLLFKRDRYFVIVNSAEGEPGAIPAMLDFGRFIAGRLPADQQPALAQALPREGLIEGSVRLLRGPFALEPLFTLGEGDVLRLRSGGIAAAARYRDPVGERVMILAEYPNAQAARSAFGHLRANLDAYLKVESAGGAHLIFKDHTGKYGRIALAGNRIITDARLAQRPGPP